MSFSKDRRALLGVLLLTAIQVGTNNVHAQTTEEGITVHAGGSVTRPARPGPPPAPAPMSVQAEGSVTRPVSVKATGAVEKKKQPEPLQVQAQGAVTRPVKVQAEGAVEKAPEEPIQVKKEGSVTRPTKVQAEGAVEKPQKVQAEGAVTKPVEVQARGFVDKPEKAAQGEAQKPTDQPTTAPTDSVAVESKAEVQKPTDQPTALPAPTQTEADDEADAVPTQTPTKAIVATAAESPTKAYKPKKRKDYTNETLYFEDFEQGNDHSWTHADEKVAQSDYFTNFLGRFGQAEDGSNAFTQTAKTYPVPSHAEWINVDFDFFELDLWCHCDKFHVMICNQTVEMGEFSQSGPSEQSGTTPGGIDWIRHATVRNTDLGFSHYRDGVHKMGLSIPQKCYSDGLLEVKFNITIDGGYELASAGIDNINITAYNIPPEETESPTMAPTQEESQSPTEALDLDICISDAMYDFKVGATVHKKCFDLLAETVDDVEVIGQACVNAIVGDTDNLQLEVKHKGPWDLRTAFAWTGESLDDAPRLPSSNKVDLDAFPAKKTWSEGEVGAWVTTLPLLNANEHCANGVDEFSEAMIVHAEGAGSDEENGQAFAREHYDMPGDFYWAQLVFSCHCDRSEKVEPPSTGAPTEAPSRADGSTDAPAPTSPTDGPTKRLATPAPSTEDFEAEVGRCVASVDGSGKECHPLIGEDKTYFGQVCVELVPSDDEDDPNDTLNVTYTTNGDYRLTRNYLWVGEAGSSVPTMERELEEPLPDLEAFPHFACNWLGTTTWTKLISWGSQCQDMPGDAVLRLSLVAHSEVATATSDGTVALGTIGTRAFGVEHTKGTLGDPSWYEIIHFRILCQCSCLRSHSGNTRCDSYIGSPTMPPSENPTGTPTTSPTPVPTTAPSGRPSQFPTAYPSLGPSPSPTSSAPSPAPTFECRPAWAVKEGSSHCFKSIDSLNTEYETSPYGWYNGIFHLKDEITLNVYVEDTTKEDTDSEDCRHGEKVGEAQFSAQGKVVTVEITTIGDFYITESQAHVGAEMLPTDETDGSYITDPKLFELKEEDLKEGTTSVDHFLRGCQEDNWVVARAVVCGSFVE